MCGIFGYSFPKGAVSGFKRGVLASSLAKLNDERGGHSWGILGLVKGNYEIHRGLGDLFSEIGVSERYTTMYAHTRWATIGEKTIANAHPFDIGNIIGAHNGMISNHWELMAEYDRDFAVDSMHMIAHLNDNLPFEDIEGYGALEWYDKLNPGRIYLSRLKGGELCIMGLGKESDKKTQGLVWSSDEMHLIEAMNSAGITEAFEYQVNEGAVYYIENNQLYLEESRHLNLMHRPRSLITYGSNSGASYGSSSSSSSSSSGRPWGKWEDQFPIATTPNVVDDPMDDTIDADILAFARRCEVIDEPGLSKYEQRMKDLEDEHMALSLAIDAQDPENPRDVYDNFTRSVKG